MWAEDGFILNMQVNGAIDFAGGTVVHISDGISGSVAVIYRGARHGYPKTVMHPSNLVMTMIGAGLLWVGWFGFDTGSVNFILSKPQKKSLPQFSRAGFFNLSFSFISAG